MSPVRRFLSMSSLLLAAVAMAGCYDLSDPSGPRRDAFVRDKNPTETQEQGQTSAEAEDEPAPGATDDDDATATAAAVAAGYALRNQLRIVPDEAD